MTDLHLTQPTGLQPTTWVAIAAALERLNRALAVPIGLQTVGCCKELVESVAKVVLEERGQTVESNAKYPNVVHRAHDALDRQPGKGLTDSPPLRDVAGGLKTIATQFAELRNAFGSGHGRPYEPEVADEITAVCVDAAMLWVRWALRRLEQQLYGAMTPLISDLEGNLFRTGDLAERLVAANLPDLAEPNQRRLGVAVGQRAMRDTFVVQADGVEACVAGGLEQWPLGYRRGLLAGLLLDHTGTITISGWSIGQLPGIAEPLPDPGHELATALDHVADAPLPRQLEHDLLGRYALGTQMRLAAARLPAKAAASWLRLADRVNAGPY